MILARLSTCNLVVGLASLHEGHGPFISQVIQQTVDNLVWIHICNLDCFSDFTLQGPILIPHVMKSISFSNDLWWSHSHMSAVLNPSVWSKSCA